jgi:hypothetical protein
MGKKKSATAGEPKKKGPGKGGPRPNSGRKPIHAGGTVQMSLRVPQDVAEWAAASGLTQSSAITQAVRTCPAYRIWKGEQKPNQ